MLASPESPVRHPPRFFAASTEGVLLQAHAQLAGRYDRYVLDRIERTSKGTDSALDDAGGNTDARKIAFELGQAAWLVSCGLKLSCDDPADDSSREPE